MVVAHYVAHDLCALAVLGVGGEVLHPHRVENAALYRLQAVADVRQRARRNDRERVIEISLLCGLVQRHVAGAILKATATPTCRRRRRHVAATGGRGTRRCRFNGASFYSVREIEERRFWFVLGHGMLLVEKDR